jgi:hypothetical protein
MRRKSIPKKLTPWPVPLFCQRIHITEDVDMEDVYSVGLESDPLDMDSGLGGSVDVNEQGRGSANRDMNIPEETDWSSPSTEKLGDCKDCDDDEEPEDGLENEKDRKHTHTLVSLTGREMQAKMIAVHKYLYDVHASATKGLNLLFNC